MGLLESLDLKTVGLEPTRTPDDGEAATGLAMPPLKRIRERHQSLARAIALHPEKSQKQIALEHGIAPGTLSRLCGDQTFKDLVEHYKQDLEVALEDTVAKLSTLSREAIDELQERLDNNPDDLTTGQLIEIVKMSADRSGHGPTSQQNVNINVGLANRLNEARERVKQIDAKARVVEKGK